MLPRPAAGASSPGEVACPARLGVPVVTTTKSTDYQVGAPVVSDDGNLRRARLTCIFAQNFAITTGTPRRNTPALSALSSRHAAFHLEFPRLTRGGMAGR